MLASMERNRQEHLKNGSPRGFQVVGVFGRRLVLGEDGRDHPIVSTPVVVWNKLWNVSFCA